MMHEKVFKPAKAYFFASGYKSGDMSRSKPIDLL
jgi:hypothetical protein